MRLPFSTLFLGNLALFSLFPSLGSAIHPVALSRGRDQSRSAPPAVLTSRQYRVARDLLDVCINANVDLLADVSQVLGLGSILGPLDLGTNIQLCLCLKDLDLYLETNDNVQALIGLLGKNAIGSLITAVINTSPQSQSCTFPQHAHHTCNTNDPCHYECDAPYVLQGGQCVCAPPYSSCNGVCDLHPQSCGSAVPHSLLKRTNAIVTIAQAKASCKSHETVCGIPGQGKALAFECIDVSSNAESCGGCTTPHPFFEARPIRPAAGQDCTAISNAKSTTCSKHQCVVKSCSDGWMPSLDQTACVVDTSAVLRMRRIAKRSDPIPRSASTTATLDSDLVSQLVQIVKLLLDLNAHAPTKPTADASSALSISGRLADVNTATAALINATAVPSSLPAFVGALLDTCWLLDNTLHDCDCVQNLGLSDFMKDVEELITATLALQSWCEGHPFTGTTPSTAVPSSASNSVIVGLSDVLTAGTLGLLGEIKSGVAVDGLDSLLGPGTSDLLNNLLNGLLLGPDNYKRENAPPLTANANATVSVGGDLLTQIEALVRSILNLGGLLNLMPSTTSSLSSANPVPIDPSLWTALEQSTGDLLQSYTAGLLCPTLDGLYVTERRLEAALGLGGDEYENALNELISIINYTVALQVLCQEDVVSTSLPSPTSATASTHGTTPIAKTSAHSTTPATSTTHPVSISSSPSPPSKTITSKTPATSSSVSFSLGVPATSARPPSTTPPHPITSSTPSASSGAVGVPIIVGLDGLLNGLGLGGVVTVGDGLLGDDVDGSVNDLLNGLGIGPNGVRRRGQGHDEPGFEKRQVTANATADALVGGSLVTAIQQVLDLVLGLNASASSLPPAASSSPSVEPSTASMDCTNIDNIMDATWALLSSTTYAELLSSTNWLVNASVASLDALEACFGIADPVLTDLQDYLVQLVEASEDLLALCPPVPAGSSTSTSPISPQPPASEGDIEIGLTKLLSALGLDVKADTTVSGLLGSNLDNTINAALDALGIGPSGMKRRVRRVVLADR